MQNSPSTSGASTLSLVLWFVATPLISGISALFAHLLSRPKQSAEIHKTEAEAQEIQSSIMMKIYGRLDDYEAKRQKQNDTIVDLENRLFDSQYAGRQKESEVRRLQNEIEILNLQVQKARARGFLAEDRVPGSPNPAA